MVVICAMITMNRSTVLNVTELKKQVKTKEKRGRDEKRKESP